MGRNPVVSVDLGLLRQFWSEAEIPVERLPYLEFQARRYSRIVELLSSVGPLSGSRVLDLGAGVGSLSVALHHALGGTYDLGDFLPPSPATQAALARYGVERTFQCDLSAPTPLAGVPEDYDVVLLVEVLEHLLVNPLLLFRSIAGHMAAGGTLLLTTPNMGRLRNRLKLLRGRSIKEPGRYPTRPGLVYGHVVEYTLDELDHLLEFEGFRRLRGYVTQQTPVLRPTFSQRAGVRLLNSRLFVPLQLGDNIQALYRRTPPEESPPPPLPRPERI